MPSILPKEEDIAFYNTNGYWISPKAIDDERLELLKRHMDKVYRWEFETGREPFKAWKDSPGLRQTDNCHWADYVLRDLATDPLIGEMAAILLGTDEVRLWHDQLLCKPPGGNRKTPGNVGWHQDYVYWQCCAEPSLVTAWVAFDDVDVSNGCMQVVPGSHQWGLINVNNFFEQDLKKQEEEMVLEEGQTFRPIPLVMKAGQVSFHHPLTIHGSGPNTSDRFRRSMAIHIMADETVYKSGSRSDLHLNVTLMKPKDGDKFIGESFPTLFSRKT